MTSYRLSEQAAADIDAIYLYGIVTFGLVQADVYVDGMQAHLARLAVAPYMYPAIDFIRPGYRRSVYGSHAIYYRLYEDGVLIVRILHGQDIDTAL